MLADSGCNLGGLARDVAPSGFDIGVATKAAKLQRLLHSEFEQR
jgi:hypothetical protein